MTYSNEMTVILWLEIEERLLILDYKTAMSVTKLEKVTAIVSIKIIGNFMNVELFGTIYIS